MKKRSLLLGLSLMTAVSPVSLLAGPGHDEHSEGFFSRLIGTSKYLFVRGNRE